MRLGAALLLLSGCLDFSALEGRNGDLSSSFDFGTFDFATSPDLQPPFDLAPLPDLLPPSPFTTLGGVALQPVSGTVRAILAPSGVQAGDLVLVWIWWDDPTKTLTPDAKLTQIQTQSKPGFLEIRYYEHVATGPGPISYTFQFSGGVDSSAMSVAYHGATAVDGTPQTVQLSGPPFDLGPIVTASPQEQVVAMLAWTQIGGTPAINWTVPAQLRQVGQTGGGVMALELYAPVGGSQTLGALTTTDAISEILGALAILK